MDSELFRLRFCALLLCPLSLISQENHNHTPPEKLGSVSFPISCAPGVQQEFNRGIALLHSFAYNAAENTFRGVEQQDPHCAIAHWGIAMTHFHELWDPPLEVSTIPIGQAEIRQAQALGGSSERERRFIDALACIFERTSTVPYAARALQHERAMCDLSAEDRKDVEAQVFCALALLSNASPLDKSHARQKKAAEILEPLSHIYPQHPGIFHYLIHAYDNAELAPRGLSAAKAYSRIAPSAPHALHMPSHIFTRLGLWNDSIASNIAARNAAGQQREIREELHAMDYLVYAYLQLGRYSDAAQVLQDLREMPKLDLGDFVEGHAATAIPVRYAVERQQWSDAANLVPPTGAPPHVVAVAVWARGLGCARIGRVREARAEAQVLRSLEDQLRTAGNEYWATQVKILRQEIIAWITEAAKKPDRALALMREAANQEDAIEKLPVTPGPVLPAREQLGYLLLQQQQPCRAANEFRTALALAPGRLGAINGALQAGALCH